MTDVEAVVAAVGTVPTRVLVVDVPPHIVRALDREGRSLVPVERAHDASDGSFEAAVAWNVVGTTDAAARMDLAQRLLRPGGRFHTFERSRRRARAQLQRFFDVEAARRVSGGWLWSARVRPTSSMVGHFNEVAPDYATQIPAHVRQHYLSQKLRAFDRLLEPAWRTTWGVDVGAGLGWYANALAERNNARVVAVDPSTVPLAIGKREAPETNPPAFVAGDSLHLPFRNATFHYAYAINMVHHLKRGEQERAFREIHRILRPGGAFLLFEINIRNPLFRWYMRQVFPRTRRIDRGDEEFVHPHRLPLVPEFHLEKIEYSTFAPDFLPRWSLHAVRAIERALERTRWARYSIHYTALLRKRA